MSKFKVVTTSVTFGKINKEPYQRLIDAGCEVITNNLGRPYTHEEIVAVGKDADAIIVGTDHVPESVVRELENVKIIAKHGVGFDPIDLEYTKERGIFVTNVPGSNSNEVADLVFGFIISLARNICLGNKEVRDGLWNKRSGISLYKKTLGVVGTGNIGLSVIRRAVGFNMNIIAYDLNQNKEALELGVKYVDLDTLLTESDFITLHLPNTPETEGIIDKKAMKQMKDEVLLINTAREQLVNLDDLNDALANKVIRGYATDVYADEPTPYLPYFDNENVVLSPHIGATTKDANLVMGQGAVDCVLAVKEGKRPPEQCIRNGI